MVRLIRRVAPALPIHGSTQMSITSAKGAEFARALGVERVVVGRELSVAEIARVGAESHAEVEAFVHGALCVSYRWGPGGALLQAHMHLLGTCCFLRASLDVDQKSNCSLVV